jgi:pimeloyl-ACP methyl ester carboxylesterase
MPTFTSAAGDFHYIDEGHGAPIVLVHGFASNHRVNWVNPGWVDWLTAAGRRVVALDVRGHGDSVKFHTPGDYLLETMAGDVAGLIEHLGLGRVDALGYSMGARILTALAIEHPETLRSVTLGGMGAQLLSGTRGAEKVAEALEAPSRAEIRDAEGRRFRAFAEQTGSDLKALAACMRSIRRTFTPEDLARIAVPVLVAVGTRDDVAGPAGELAARIPGARALDIPNRDHMLAVGDPVFKRGVVEFLGSLGEG